MELNKYVIGGTVAAVVAIGVVVYWVASKKDDIPAPPFKEPNVEAFKKSMEERYKHPESIHISDEARAEIIKGVHYNIQNDIKSMFSVIHHIELNAYNEKLFKKHS
jgi:hypothetical protein